MSAALMGRATWLQNVSCPEKMVLVAIADVADDHGLAYMLIETLMMKSSLSRRGVQTAIAGLVEKKILMRRERRHRSSIFKIVVEALPLRRPPPSDRELSDDHFWDNIQGAPDAPSNEGVGAGGAPQRAGHAPQGAGGAHILPVDTPVITPDSPTPLTGGTPPQDLFGNQVQVETSEALHEYVARGWEALRADYPRTNAIKVWNDSRINAVKARAAEFIKGTGSALDHRGVWDLMFAAIRADQWLRGEAAASQRYPTPFSLSIDYLLRPRTFATILEKAATNEHDNRDNHDPVTGRRFGPAEQAGRRTLQSVVDAAKSRDTGGDTRSRYGARRSYIRES